MNTTSPVTKKPWAQPQLLVLVRSHPDEAVLGNCKDIVTSPGPNGANHQCIELVNVCTNCASLLGS